jgi:hypothetical protein
MFHRVLAVWHNKSKLEIKTFQKPITEVVSLDHAELLNRLFTNRKLDSANEKEYSQISSDPLRITRGHAHWQCILLPSAQMLKPVFTMKQHEAKARL